MFALILDKDPLVESEEVAEEDPEQQLVVKTSVL
jgi:hypothetical protein